MSEMDLPRSGLSDRGREGPMAARLRRIVEGDLLPRFLVSHGVGPLPDGLRRRLRARLGGRFQEFLALLRSRPTQAQVDEWLDEVVQNGHEIQDVLEELVTPIARRMGTMWEEDECDFVEVTLVCSQLQASLRRLSQRFAHPHEASLGRILVGGLPGATHTLGILMVAEAFASAGYEVQLASPFGPGADPRGFDIFAFTLSRTECVDEAREYLERMRSIGGDRLRVIVGGAAFSNHPELVDGLGADGWAEDPVAALSLVHGMLHPRLRHLPHAFLATAPSGHA